MTLYGLDLIEARLNEVSSKVKRRGDKITACCPAHADSTPSLSAGVGQQRDVVLHCHAGCTPDEIMAALDVQWTDLGPPRQQTTTQPVEYPYHDENGVNVYKVVRKPGKKFLQARPDGSGGWIWSLSGVQPVPYRLPKVIAAVAAGRTIYVAEGEKDVEALERAGVVATCNSGGAGQWKSHHAKWLAGATVVVIADRDKPGYAHAETVKRTCEAVGCTVTMLEAAPPHKDAADHLGAGLGLDDFRLIGEEVEEWPDPIPLGSARDCPTFPVDAFPAWIGDYVRAVAKNQQVAIDLPAQLAIAALSVVSAKHYLVDTGAWTEPVNTYTVTALPPSAGKSPVFKRMCGFVDRYEAELIDSKADEVALARQKRRMIEKNLAKAESAGDTAEAMHLLDQLADHPEPVEPRLLADDITVEALVELLRTHGRLGLLSPEGGLFDTMVGRYSDKANLDPYLQSWDGGTIRMDRIARGHLIARNPLLTVGLAVQPSVIEKLAEKPELKGRGLTARFMFAVPADFVGYRNLIDIVPVPTGLQANYEQRLTALLAREVPSTPRTIRMSPGAYRAWSEWRQGHEVRRRPNADLREIADWVTKMHSTVARVAALLHIADGRDDRDEIDVETARRAMMIGDFWIAHAKIVADLWGADETTSRAKVILSWLRETGATTFTIRDLMRARGGRFRKAEDALEPLTLLADRLWIKPLADGPILAGRRGAPSPEFAVSPHALTSMTTDMDDNHPAGESVSMTTDMDDNSIPAESDQGFCPKLSSMSSMSPKTQNEVSSSLCVDGEPGYGSPDMDDMNDNSDGPPEPAELLFPPRTPDDLTKELFS